METSLKSAGDGIAPGSAKQTGNRTSTVRRQLDNASPGVAKVQAYADTNGVAPERAANSLFVDAQSRDRGLGCLFYEIANLAVLVESLLNQAVQQTHADTAPETISSACDLVGKIGWFADLGSSRLDEVMVRGGADQWLLSPTTRKALYGEQS